MRTYSPKPGEVNRVWHVIDAKDVVLGRLATQAATLLGGGVALGLLGLGQGHRGRARLRRGRTGGGRDRNHGGDSDESAKTHFQPFRRARRRADKS